MPTKVLPFWRDREWWKEFLTPFFPFLHPTRRDLDCGILRQPRVYPVARSNTDYSEKAMALRATKPEPTAKRLKMLLFGPAGVGKTTAGIQFPAAYVIDTERGTENYDQAINAAGSVVLKTADLNEVLKEVRELATTEHPYRTLFIDPVTVLYTIEAEKAERALGTDFGRHWAHAAKQMKRLMNLITQLDMNVIMSAHAKNEYADGDSMKKIGYTFDAWKGLDYAFDLVLELSRPNKKAQKRVATVRKTRISNFPDMDTFEWTYEAFRERYPIAELERDAAPRQMATVEDVAQLRQLLETVKLPEGTVERWHAKAGVEAFEDYPADIIQKCIAFVRDRIPANRINGQLR